MHYMNIQYITGTYSTLQERTVQYRKIQIQFSIFTEDALQCTATVCINSRPSTHKRQSTVQTQYMRTRYRQNILDTLKIGRATIQQTEQYGNVQNIPELSMWGLIRPQILVYLFFAVNSSIGNTATLSDNFTQGTY